MTNLSLYNKAQMDTKLESKQDVLTFDNAPTAGSDNPVKSSGIKTALDAKQDKSDLTHETWTFTLEDDTTVTKEVVLWTGARLRA